MSDARGEAEAAARRLLDYLGSPRVQLTFAHDAKIVAEYVLSLRPGEIARQLRAQIPSSTDPARLERMARVAEQADPRAALLREWPEE